MQASMPYRVYGGLRFFERAEIKDTLAYLRLIANRADDAAFERAVNTPTRGIGERTLDQVRQRARDSAVPLWDAALLEIAQGALAGRAKNALRGFVELIEKLAGEGSLALAEQIDHVLATFRPARLLRGGTKGSAACSNRAPTTWTNSSPWPAASRASDDEGEDAMPELVAFLAYASLEAGEGQAEAWEDGVQLMTLHSAKGLEFPLVFLPAWKKVCSPASVRSTIRPALEEERRLAYVGITRARQKLVLSYAESRRIHGSDMYGVPSRFLREIPAAVLCEVRPRVQVSRPAYAPRFVEAPSHALKLGQRVRHGQFGEGFVVAAEGSGAHARVQVNFEDSGSKWLVLSYANLQAV
jgi:DNA helicase-2/ATP-dependent DNA helicase PcrA